MWFSEADGDVGGIAWGVYMYGGKNGRMRVFLQVNAG